MTVESRLINTDFQEAIPNTSQVEQVDVKVSDASLPLIQGHQPEGAFFLNKESPNEKSINVLPSREGLIAQELEPNDHKMTRGVSNKNGMSIPISPEDLLNAHQKNDLTLFDFLSLSTSELSTLSKIEFETVESLSKSFFTKQNGYSLNSTYAPEDYRFSAFNRYPDVLPYAHNTATLRSPFNSRFFKCDIDYVNASPITLHESKYIACSAPMPLAFAHFWSMVLEQGSDTIVMLTKLEENSTTKADSYIPDEFDKPKKYGPIKVTRIAKEELNKNITYSILSVQKGNDIHTIHHYHYEGWPDMGRPDTTEDFIYLLETIERESPKEPIIAHCSAGIGRAGTFIAIHSLCTKFIQSINDTPLEISEILKSTSFDLVETVIMLRAQRLGMIQTEDQYLFIKEVIRERLRVYSEYS